MPYIALDRRELFNPAIQKVVDSLNECNRPADALCDIIMSVLDVDDFNPMYLTGISRLLTYPDYFYRLTDSDKELHSVLTSNNATVGDRNYVITQLVLGTNPKRYGDFNKLIGVVEYVKRVIVCEPFSSVGLFDALGILECMKLELYRRKVAPYEDLKVKESADIPGYVPVYPDQSGSAAPEHVKHNKST